MNTISMENKTITQYFEADHDRLDELFKNFQSLKRSDYPKAKESFRDFKFGLQRHIVWEEDIIFPIFEKKTGMTSSGPTYVMKMEHRQIGACLEEVHKKVQKQDPNSDSEEQKLLSILGDHNLKEENILYPLVDSAITDEERKSAFEAMKNVPEERYRTCCGEHHH